MNKKISWFLLIVLLVIIGIAAYLYSDTKGNSPLTSSSTEVASSTVRVPFTLYDDFRKSETNLSTASAYKNKINQDTVSFQSVASNSQNPNYNVLENGRVVGEVAGIGIAMTSFSPDNSYFAFRVRQVCGATCTSISTNVIDLKSLKLINIYPPVRQKEKDANTSQYQDQIGTPVIGSYSWDSNENLQISFFYIGIDPKTQMPYRISPIEIWSYSIPNNKYTLIQSTTK